MADKPQEDDDSELLDIQGRYEAARNHASEWRKEARECFGFYAGDQWSEEDRQKLTEQQRVPVTFNRTAILLDAVIGYEMNNRQETRYIPRTQGDAKVNEMLTEAAKFFRDQCDAEFEESDAFRDMLICGMGWSNDRLTDDRNPAYDLVRDRVDPMEMMWDPSCQKPNLDDARFLFRKKFMDRKEVRSILPEWDGQYIAADWLSETDDNDNPAIINPRNRYKNKNASDDTLRDIPVVEYQYVVRNTTRIVSHPLTGETLQLDQEAYDGLDAKVKETVDSGQMPMAIKRTTEYHRCWLVGAEIVKRDQPYKEGFTYHCITGKRDRNKGTWHGIVRALRDPQMWSNKWLVQTMHLINTSAKPGYDVEKGAIDNEAKFEKNAARPGALNVFVDGALQRGRVQRRDAVGLPPDLSNLMQYSNDAMSDVSGINQELLGMADRQQAGILEYQRKQSAVTLLAPLFDSFRRYRKMAGRCWLYFMQNYLTDGRLIRITLDDGSQQYTAFQGGQQQDPGQGQQGPQGPNNSQFFDPAVSEYDVVIDQSASAPNQKEATFAALQPLMPLLERFIGPEEIQLILEYSPMPDSFMEKMKQITQQRAQQPPQPSPDEQKAQSDIQAKQADSQMKQQAMQVEFGMKQQQQQADLQFAREQAADTMQLKHADMQIGIQLEREKAAAMIDIEREKAANLFELDKLKLANTMAIERMKAEGQIEIMKLTAANKPKPAPRAQA